MFCTQCGKEITNGSQFCPGCGAQQGSGGSVNTQSQPPQNQMPQYQQTQPPQYTPPQYQQAPPSPQPPQYRQPQYQPPQYQPQPPQGAFVSAPPKKKKRGCLIAVIAVLLIFGVLIVAAALNGGEISFSTANVAEACMASQIDMNTFEPVTKTDVFAQTDSVIYVTAIVKNAPDKTKVSAIWYYISTGDSMRSENDIYTKDANTRIQFSLTNSNGFISGDYKVEILLNDQVKETVNFQVK